MFLVLFFFNDVGDEHDREYREGEIVALVFLKQTYEIRWLLCSPDFPSGNVAFLSR